MPDFDLDQIEQELARRETQPFDMPRMDKVSPIVLDKFAPLAQEFHQETGYPLKVTDTFRTNAEQVDLKKRKPYLAATPGKSRHEFGDALDVDQNQIQKYGVDNWNNLLARHGFVQPAMSKGEFWHIELPRSERAGKLAAAVNVNPTLKEIEAELRIREQAQPSQQNLSEIETELASRGTPEPTAQSTPSLGATSDTLAQFAESGGGGPRLANIPLSWLTHKLEYPINKAGEFAKPGVAAMFPKATPEEVDMVVNGLTTVGNIAAGPTLLKLAGKGLSLVGKGAGAVGRSFLGNLSGKGGGAIDEAWRGEAGFTRGLRGEIGEEDLVPATQSAYGRLRKEISATYKDKLKQIEAMKNPDGTPIQLDITPIQLKTRDLMDQFRVKVNPTGELDLSSSAIDNAGRTLVKDMIEEVRNWKDKTPLGIDALKRRISGLYSESSDARAFSQGLKESIRDLLDSNIAQYADMTGTYAKDIKLSKQMASNLMLRKVTGEEFNPDQTLRRILSTTQDKFSERKNLLGRLGERTGEDLTGMVAGQSMSQVYPTGLMGKVAAGAMTPAALAHYINPAYLATLGLTIPRLQGELVRGLGKLSRGLGQLSIPEDKLAAVVRGGMLADKVSDKSDRDKFLRGLAE